MKLISLVVTVLLSLSAVAASNQTKSSKPIKTHDKQDNLGWNFYWDEEKEIKKQQEKIKKQQSASPSKPPTKTFSTKWFKENYPIIEQRAVDSPTKENMKALLFTEKVMMDKGETFARKKQYYQSLIPEIQESARLPMTGAAAVAMNSFKSEQKREALKEIANHAGLVFFYDHDCFKCYAMVPVINRLFRQESQKIYVVAKNLRGQTIKRLDKRITIIPDTGESKGLNIQVWPAVVMMRPPQDVYIIAQGAVYYKELETRLVNIAFETEILDQEWFYRVYPEQRGLISEGQIAGVPEDVLNDPVKLINHIANLAINPEGISVETQNSKDSQ